MPNCMNTPTSLQADERARQPGSPGGSTRGCTATTNECVYVRTAARPDALFVSPRVRTRTYSHGTNSLHLHEIIHSRYAPLGCYIKLTLLLLTPLSRSPVPELYHTPPPPILYSACHPYSSALASAENDGAMSCSARAKCACVIRRSARGSLSGLTSTGAGGARIDSLTASRAAETHRSTEICVSDLVHLQEGDRRTFQVGAREELGAACDVADVHIRGTRL